MKYLSVDFGMRRVGLALSEGILASPLKIIHGQSLDDLVLKVSEVAKTEQIDKIIIGKPEGFIGRMVEVFAELFRKKGYEVDITDETLSTQDAIANMIEGGVSKKNRRLPDAEAASIILQNYLDNQ